MYPPGDDFDVRAAHATLIALRALLPPREAALGPYYRLLPALNPLDRPTMLRALSEMPKPIRCLALAMGDALAVATWAGTAPESLASPGAREAIAAMRAAHRRDVLRDHPEARLVLSAPGEGAVVFSPQELWRWQDEYDVLNLGMAWNWVDRRPDTEVRRLGGTARVKLTGMRAGGSNSGGIALG